MQYFPFVGNVYGSPSVLSGSIDDIINEAIMLREKGVQGVDLLAYRYLGNPIELAQKLNSHVDTKIILAGSVNSYTRLKEVNNIDPWAFTIGGALFNGSFAQGKGFRTNLIKVIELMNSLK